MSSWYMFKNQGLSCSRGREDESRWERGCPCSALLLPRDLDKFYLFFRLTSRVVMLDILL